MGRRRIWFGISAAIIVAGLISLGMRGLNLGIDFKGGTSWTVPAPGVTQAQATDAVQAAGLQPAGGRAARDRGHQQVEVQADLHNLPQAQQTTIKTDVTAAMAKLAHIGPEARLHHRRRDRPGVAR